MRFTLTCLFAFALIFSGKAQNNSVLSEGTWFKIAITSPGVYSITTQDLKNLGVQTEQINPRNIALYGNGGSMLPQANSAFRYSDLTENAIIVTGQEDGIFSSNDSIVFYAQGPNTWLYDTTNKDYDHVVNLYDNSNYYFLLLDKASPGKRVQESNTTNTGQILRTYHERMFHEKELVNVNHSGRMWFGEVFDQNLDQSFSFNMSGISSPTYKLEIATLGRSVSHTNNVTFQTTMDIQANGTLLETVKYSFTKTLDKNLYKPQSDYKISNYNVSSNTIQNPLLTLRFIYNKNGITAPSSDYLYGGLLDYIELEYERKLALGSFTQKTFNYISPDQNLSYQFKTAKTHKSIWNISNPLVPEAVVLQHSGDSTVFAFSSQLSNEFIAFERTQIPKPAMITPLANQNIHGLATTPELVIFTTPGLKNNAQKLADFHSSHSGLHVLTVTTDEVYNEFSSGKRDISAIRDLCRYFYQKDGQLKYLLLFGMGSYDFKKTAGDAQYYIPIYQSRESFNPINSYASDDYFGFMEDNEGTWSESPTVNHTMDIGVGRLPISNPKEADIVVDKIITYASDPKAMGKWRNNIALFGDDYDTNLHIKDNELAATYIGENYPNFNLRKLYVGRYYKTILPGVKEISPEMSTALTKTINDGALIFNYVGHGAPRRLSGGLIDADQAKTWSNKYKLPFFITATCEFAVADHPDVYSLGREIVLMKDAGGIAIFSGTRAAYASSNKIVVNSMFKHLFDPSLRFGDVIRKAKNGGLSGIYNRHFIFLGDPALRLNIPTQQVRLTSVNGNSPLKCDSVDIHGVKTLVCDTLTALGVNTLEGEVVDMDGNVLSDFDGKVVLTVYNNEKTIKTLGQEDPVYTFKERVNELFSGIASVTNGTFTIEFILPKEAADSLGSAKISMYAYTANGLDAAGSNNNLWTGEIASNAPADNTPPTITMYLDSVAFQSGDTVSKQPMLIAELSDESGINQSSSDSDNYLVSMLNLDSSIVMNGHFVSNTDDYKKGTLQYQFHNLPKGNYTLELWASDNYNNRASESINFVVFDIGMGIFHPVVSNFLKVKAYPNPFSDQTNLVLDQGNHVQATIAIHDATGRLIRQMDQVSISANQAIQWDGKDINGTKVPQGIYMCTISIPEKQAQQSIMLMVR